jgi:site-specific recombinase XerD
MVGMIGFPRRVSKLRKRMQPAKFCLRSIPHITFHELRHTTASRLNEKGVDILTIKEILDHADLKTTQQYTHTPRKNILDAVNVLESY